MPVAESIEKGIASLKRQQEETAWRLRMLEYSQKVLNARVEAVENSLIFRFLRSVGKPLLLWKARVDQLSRRFRFHEAAPADAQYERWLLREVPMDTVPMDTVPMET